MLRAKGCCAATSSKSIKTPFMLRAGTLVDIPEGVALVSADFAVAQYPVIQDRKAAPVLTDDHACQLWLCDDLIL